MGAFEKEATVRGNPRWEQLTKREERLYEREDDIRSPFARDYTRILHSSAFRRLKHKTQVFYNVDNDHICTRMEHVAHVESVSNTIAKSLGLNDELTKAIAFGHDLGHAPFGHQGETVLSMLSERYVGETFWHERNGLRFVDSVELLEDNYRVSRNLDLTYAVRDGIISHCGEVDQNGLRPREELIDLGGFTEKNMYEPATWEGCVVKLSDKIAYLGRDIEDAVSLGFLNDADMNELRRMAQANDGGALNTTVIMHNMIIDVCANSTPERGICMSERFSGQMRELKAFNTERIYKNRRFGAYCRYSELVLTQLYETLSGYYSGADTWKNLSADRKFYPTLLGAFIGWLAKYCESGSVPEEARDPEAVLKNRKIYGKLETEKIYAQAIIDFLSGMTDRFALKVFEELLTY